jgi:hypothetical protein
VKMEYDHIKKYGNYFVSSLNGKKGLISQRYEVLLDPQYDSLFALNYGQLWLAQKRGKWGLIEPGAEGTQERVPFELDEVQLKETYYSYHTVKKNGKWGVLDDKFRWFIEPKYEYIKYDPVSKEFECLKENKQNDCYFLK